MSIGYECEDRNCDEVIPEGDEVDWEFLHTERTMMGNYWSTLIILKSHLLPSDKVIEIRNNLALIKDR